MVYTVGSACPKSSCQNVPGTRFTSQRRQRKVVQHGLQAKACLVAEQKEQGGFEEEVKAKQPIMLGRKDYLIRSLDPGTGMEHWNVTYSEIVHLDLEQPTSADSSPSKEITSWESLDGAHPDLACRRLLRACKCGTYWRT